MPDLVIVDGGKGQVGAAKEVLDELGLHDLPLAGLAKEREELFLPGHADPIVLPHDITGAVPRPAHARRGAPVRDHLSPGPAREAARVRRRSTTCPASGPSAGASCSSVFGSIKRVREAPVEQIAAVPGIGRALAAGSRRRWRPDRRASGRRRWPGWFRVPSRLDA